MENHHHYHESNTSSRTKLALSATLHCLLGCGLGEVAGMIIGTVLSLSNTSSIVLAIILGFIFGFILGMRPLLKAGYTYPKAFRQVLIAEGISIAVMEIAEVLIEIYVPGVMQAHLNESIFWIGMLLALIAGFIAAYPVNYLLTRKGITHQH